MDNDEGAAVRQKLLEEMLWVFRVEDASPWNYAILTLTFIVIVISFVLLGKSIQANRKRKLLPQETQTPTMLHTRDKDENSINTNREMLLTGHPNSTQMEIQLEERDGFLPGASESET